MKSPVHSFAPEQRLSGSSFLMVLFLLCFLQPPHLHAQVREVRKEYRDMEADKIIPGAAFVKAGPVNALPSFVTYRTNTQVPFNTFLPTLKSQLQLNQALDFKILKEEKDALGFTHYRYVQTYLNIPIDESSYIIHVKNNLVSSFNGRAFQAVPGLSPQPSLSGEQALQKALQAIGAQKYKWEDDFWNNEIKRRTNNPEATYFPQAELYWLTGQNNATYRLAYRFDIYAANPDKAERMYIDASTGEVIRRIPLESNCSSATVTTIFNGDRTISTDKYTADNFRLRDNCQTATIRIRDWNSSTTTANPIEIENTTNTWTTMNEQFGGTVLYYTKQSYNYWLNVHSRQSYDNANGSIEGYINAVFSSGGSTTTNNASMSFSGGTMKVGLGSSGTLANSWSTLDIIGHEYAHAVTGATSELEYQNESGALNESFSDIFGEALENYTLGSTDWLLGNERTSGAIRSMSNPNTYNDPDTYLGTNWYSGSNDNGGVHTNSGVQNYWFFLLSVGGNGTNDNGDNFSVSGIGIDKASAIAARNLTVYMGKNSTYADARTNAIQAAIDLYGECSNEVIQTTNAWYAVGVGEAFLEAEAVVSSDYNGRDVSCFGACNGTATVNIISGSNLTFEWNTGALTQSVSGLCPGTYTVKITNQCGSGSAITRSVVIENTPLLTLSALATSDFNGYHVSCNGASDGTASATAAGGTTPYSYEWSNGQTIAEATSLAAGNYSVTVTDVNGCKATANVTLTEPDPLNISAGSNKIVYLGYPDSSCTTLTASGFAGGVPPYSITWSNGATGNSINVCPASTTDYTATITDKNNCTASATVRVCVIDVRCGQKLDKVVICHKTGSLTNPFETVCVDIKAAKSHFKLHPGDQLAACGTAKICDGTLELLAESSARIDFSTEPEAKSLFVETSPNPFSTFTTIRFMIDQDDIAELKISDMSGRVVANLYAGNAEAGKIYEVIMEAKAYQSGMYVLQLRTGRGKHQTSKLIIAK